MELYNAMIRGMEGLAGSSAPRRFDYDPANAWEDTGAFELVMLRDAAFELGGGDKPAVNFTCVTTSPTLIPKDEILVFGPDLGELKGDCAYARVALLRVGDIESDDEEDTEQAFRAIQDMDFVKYRVFPKGYMIRTSSESSRAARSSRDVPKSASPRSRAPDTSPAQSPEARAAESAERAPSGSGSAPDTAAASSELRRSLVRAASIAAGSSETRAIASPAAARAPSGSSGSMYSPSPRRTDSCLITTPPASTVTGSAAAVGSGVGRAGLSSPSRGRRPR